MPISSIPSIIITSSQNISFMEYVGFAGLVSFLVAISTVLMFVFLTRKAIKPSKPEGINMFLEYNPWTFVHDREMMIKVTGVFIGVIIGFIVIPTKVAKPDMIALVGAALVLILNRKKVSQVMKELDFGLLVYLMGVFVITGCLEEVGLIALIGQGLTELHISDPSIAFLMLLWIGAIASAFIDNIPITQLLVSIINILMGEKGSPNAKLGSMGLSLGITWGDNLTPFGDSILVLNVAKNHGVNIESMTFLKTNASITLIQLSVISLVVFVMFKPIFGLWILLAGLVVFGVISLIKKSKSRASP
jgi:Na+/H+ antiporter NhaD/arsenite permease-like protein